MSYIERFYKQETWKYTLCSKCTNLRDTDDGIDCPQEEWFPYFGPHNCGNSDTNEVVKPEEFNEYELFEVVPLIFLNSFKEETLKAIIESKNFTEGFLLSDKTIDYHDLSIFSWLKNSVKKLKKGKIQALAVYIKKKIREDL